MGKKVSTSNPPKCNSCTIGYDGRNGNGYQPCNCRPKPPPGPPLRIIYEGFFFTGETKESIRAREDYEKYMEGWKDGFESGINSGRN